MLDDILSRGDSTELEALFDAIARQAACDTSPVAKPESHTQIMYGQIGQLTRKLHQSLQQMDYGIALQSVVTAIPDARDRLSYIATLTQRAANRVLDATDIALPLQDELASGAGALADDWERLYANRLSADGLRLLAQQTRSFLQTVPHSTRACHIQLLEIVMAQDFQDLTGQIIMQMMDIANCIEQALTTTLISCSPEGQKPQLESALPSAGQDQANGTGLPLDDLLASLGF